MKIDTFLTPYFPVMDSHFSGSLVVMLDVLRASTTICAALYNGAKEVIPVETTEDAFQIYDKLSKESRFLGGERDGVKPDGFDVGNSPLEYTKERIHGKSIVFTTSNGTKIFKRAKQSFLRIIGSFVNLTAASDHIAKKILEINRQDLDIIFICAGNYGMLSYEDTISAGAYIQKIIVSSDDSIFLTDSAHAALSLYELHKEDFREFLRTREHASELTVFGNDEDNDIAFTIDKYPVVPVVDGDSIVQV